MSLDDIYKEIENKVIVAIRKPENISFVELAECLLCVADLECKTRLAEKAFEYLIDFGQSYLRDDSYTGLPSINSIRFILVSHIYAQHESGIYRIFTDWIQRNEFKELDPVTKSYLIGIMLENIEYIPSQYHDYIKKWHLQAGLRSQRARAWEPHYLFLAGFNDEAEKRAKLLLNERELNGSWANDFNRTVGCTYALLHYFKNNKELLPSLDYIKKRLAQGYVTAGYVLSAQIIKTLFRGGALPEKTLQSIRRRLLSNGRIFISHNHQDKDFVRKLAKDLTNEGFEPWLDEAEIATGDSIIESVNKGLHGAEYFVVVLSKNSVTSLWVQKELNAALMSRLAGRNVILLPLLIEDCEVPLLLSDISWADFRSSYEKGFSSLIYRLQRDSIAS